jgi:hypothetical protein
MPTQSVPYLLHHLEHGHRSIQKPSGTAILHAVVLEQCLKCDALAKGPLNSVSSHMGVQGGDGAQHDHIPGGKKARSQVPVAVLFRCRFCSRWGATQHQGIPWSDHIIHQSDGSRQQT